VNLVNLLAQSLGGPGMGNFSLSKGWENREKWKKGKNARAECCGQLDGGAPGREVPVDWVSSGLGHVRGGCGGRGGDGGGGGGFACFERFCFRIWANWWCCLSQEAKFAGADEG
jgi:hypothetical protein